MDSFALGLSDAPTGGATQLTYITSTPKEQNIWVFSGNIWHRLNGIFNPRHVSIRREHRIRELHADTRAREGGGGCTGAESRWLIATRLIPRSVPSIKHFARTDIFFD